MMTEEEIDNLLMLDMEYKLAVARCIATDDKVCSSYFIRRRETLIPEIIISAREQGLDPVEHFAAFAKKVHARFCTTPEGEIPLYGPY